MINLKLIPLNDCETVKRYGKDIDQCDTLDKLKEKLAYWKPLAEDAYKLVQTMNEARFKKFVKALKKERKGVYGNNEDCCVIALPMPMFKISQVAIHFKAPFGCALHQMLEQGDI
jgi:hypothetical protein